ERLRGGCLRTSRRARVARRARRDLGRHRRAPPPPPLIPLPSAPPHRVLRRPTMRPPHPGRRAWHLCPAAAAAFTFVTTAAAAEHAPRKRAEDVLALETEGAFGKGLQFH